MDNQLRIYLPPFLQELNGQNEFLSIPSCKVEALASQIGSCYPAFKLHLLNEEGEISGFVNVYVNGQNHRDLDRNRLLLAEDRIEMVTSLVGG